MELFITFIGNIATVIVELYMFLMIVRVFMQFLPVNEDGWFFDFVYTVTEMIISPVRNLLDKFTPLGDLPVDLSFILTYVLLGIVDIILLMV